MGNHSAHVFMSDNMFFMSKKNMSLQNPFLTTIETTFVYNVFVSMRSLLSLLSLLSS